MSRPRHRPFCSAPVTPTTLRRRRKVAWGLATIAGVTGFFSLYVLSWVLILEL